MDWGFILHQLADELGDTVAVVEGLDARDMGEEQVAVLHGVGALAQPCGVDNMQWQAIDLDVFAQYVACGALDRGDDGTVLSRQGV